MSTIRRRSLLYALNTIEVSQIITIKESGTYTVPSGTIRIDVFMVGAGGGGGLPVAPTSGYTAGHKGKGGSAVYYENIPFTKGEEISVTIGLAGKGATTANTAGTDGGDTLFGDYTVAGGKGGAKGTNTSTSAGNDGSMACPFGAIDSESITDTALFGADGGDGSTTTTALAGGTTGGGKGANSSTAASSATFYGAGGGGGTIYKTWISTTIRETGDGYDGIVILRVTRKVKESDKRLVAKYNIITDTTQTTYTIPEHEGSIDIFLVGGGGSGYSANSRGTKDHCGGYGGSVVTQTGLIYETGTIVNVSVASVPTSVTSANGNSTTFDIYTAAGGIKGKQAYHRGSLDGVACPFGAVNADGISIKSTDLFGASAGNYSVSDGDFDTGGTTGGGNCSDVISNVTAGSFYGAGGGSYVDGSTANYSKKGYQGIIIIRYWVYEF